MRSSDSKIGCLPWSHAGSAERGHVGGCPLCLLGDEGLEQKEWRICNETPVLLVALERPFACVKVST